MSPNTPESIESAEMAEAAACRSYTEAAPPGVAASLGLAVRDVGSSVAVRASILDILMYNRVVALGVGAPADEGWLDEATGFFRAGDVPRFMVHLAPEARPEDLPHRLERGGFRLHNHWLRLLRPSTGTGETDDPRVRPIGREHAEVFARTYTEAFDHPPVLMPWIAATVGRQGWHHFASFEDGDPVGFGALFVHGRTAWFGFAATRLSHRRRGIQSGLIVARLRAAARLGCDQVAVETADDTPEKPNPSTHNLVRLGFAVAYRRPNWVLKLASEKQGAGPS